MLNKSSLNLKALQCTPVQIQGLIQIPPVPVPREPLSQHTHFTSAKSTQVRQELREDPSNINTASYTMTLMMLFNTSNVKKSIQTKANLDIQGHTQGCVHDLSNDYPKKIICHSIHICI